MLAGWFQHPGTTTFRTRTFSMSCSLLITMEIILTFQLW